MGKIAVCIVILCIRWIGPAQEACVTYDFSGGRFGDCLLSYLHAKWISYKYGIPVAYRSFPLSLHLVMERLEQVRPFKIGYHRVPLESIREHEISPSAKITYVCPYFPEDPWELEHTAYPGSGRPYYSFQTNWKDPSFRKLALAMIQPVRELTLTRPQGNGVAVALHFREGGGFDDDGFRTLFPLKLPPIEFYIDGVRAVLDLFHGKHIDCQVFTDAEQPERWIRQIQEALPPDAPIQFKYRRTNHHRRNVLEDFFSLFLYDVLIRSQSNFSLIPSLLHDFAVVYSPKDCVVEGKSVRITEVSLEIDESQYLQLQ